jgi:hypothetical protein
LSNGKALFKTTWYLEPVPDIYPWVLGTSALGSASYLAY